MLSPIRPLQSTEVRRVDEVTPRKSVVPRVATPFAEPYDDVRLSIGDDARRLAYGRDQASDQQQSGAEAAKTSPVFDAPARKERASSFAQDEADSVFTGATLPLAFQSEESLDPFGSEGAESNTFANRALRAFTASGAASQRDPVGRDSAFPEGDNERLWSSEDSSRVPFEVFQRAVTDATGGTGAARAPSSGFSPLQPVFSPPENGGEPYGRAVPFEDEEVTDFAFGPSEAAPQSDVTSKLSKEAVDELIADLSWSLPERYSVRSGEAAVA